MNKNEQDHLPVMGIGPVCIAIMIACTVAGIALVKYDMLTSGNIDNTILTMGQRSIRRPYRHQDKGKSACNRRCVCPCA